MNANSKNHWNELAAVGVKPHVGKQVRYIVIEECTDASNFVHLVAYLIDTCILERGDIFVVDNETVHTKGDN